MADAIRCGSPGFEPERLLQQRRHRRQEAVARRSRASARASPRPTRKRTNCRRGRLVPAVPVNTAAALHEVDDGERLAVGAARPLDRGRVPVVVLRPRRPGARPGSTAWVRRHHDRLRQERLVVAVVVPAERRRAACSPCARARCSRRAPRRAWPGPRARRSPAGRRGSRSRPRRRARTAGTGGPVSYPTAADIARPTPQTSSRPVRLADRRLDLVAPEGPERLPLLRDVGEREARPARAGSSRRGRGS